MRRCCEKKEVLFIRKIILFERHGSKRNREILEKFSKMYCTREENVGQFKLSVTRN